MPLVGDICGSNGIDLANESGSDNGNEICLKQLQINLANSGNEKHVKLDLNFVQENISDNLGLNGSDKVPANENENTEQGISIDNNTESNMEWTTVRRKNKRVRSNSNDSEKIKLDITVSPSKKQKSHNKDIKTTGNGNANNSKKQVQGHSDQNTKTKSGIRNRDALNKDSVLVAITEIPKNTYFNSIKMENMILNLFPKLKETGMWTKYRINPNIKHKFYPILSGSIALRP